MSEQNSLCSKLSVQLHERLCGFKETAENLDDQLGSLTN